MSFKKQKTNFTNKGIFCKCGNKTRIKGKCLTCYNYSYKHKTEVV